MSQESVDLHDKFLFSLDWLLAVTRRYATSLQFGLVHINFSDPAVLGSAYGAQEASKRLDDVLHKLRAAFRKTDLVTRQGVDFWVLVPYTPTDERLADKVKGLIELASENDLTIVERDISFFALPLSSPELDPDYSAAEFLDYLKKNHVRLASHELSMAPDATGA